MPQISKRELDKDIESEMFREFWLSLSKLRSADIIASFFSDLLTDTEKIMLAKRFTIAILLLRGKRPVEIKETLHVTNSTIGSVGSWLKNANHHTKGVLESIVQEGNWQKLLAKIDSILDELPPRYGSDWSREYAERRKRRTQRTSINKLR
jgi:uncharacterized protein YerC